MNSVKSSEPISHPGTSSTSIYVLGPGGGGLDVIYVDLRPGCPGGGVHHETTTKPPQNHRKTTAKPPQNHRKTTAKPPQNHRKTTTKPPQNHHKTQGRGAWTSSTSIYVDLRPGCPGGGERLAGPSSTSIYVLSSLTSSIDFIHLTEIH